jgi:hypothetical protein
MAKRGGMSHFWADGIANEITFTALPDVDSTYLVRTRPCAASKNGSKEASPAVEKARTICS